MALDFTTQQPVEPEYFDQPNIEHGKASINKISMRWALRTLAHTARGKSCNVFFTAKSVTGFNTQISRGTSETPHKETVALGQGPKFNKNNFLYLLLIRLCFL